MEQGVPIPDFPREFLCCPITRQPLRPATAEERGKCPGSMEEALIREDGQVLYPIRNGIPLLLPAAAVTLTPEPSPQ